MSTGRDYRKLTAQRHRSPLGGGAGFLIGLALGGLLAYFAYQKGKEVGAAAAEYRTSGGASGGATDGYLSITDAKSGQRATVVFDDLDKGLAAFAQAKRELMP